MKIHHIGYAVKDIDKALPAFEALGFTASETVFDEARKVRIAFLQNGAEYVELVAPCGENSPVSAMLKKTGAAPYHICYETDDLENALKQLKCAKFIITKAPQAAPAIKNCRVAFLYHKDLGLIELVENNKQRTKIFDFV